ncbi:hypothetical protein Bsp3421_005559 [Burkholderia sp. FERM BP-3421]|uniref:hypothetical protein n=1 Tax=Burkholderia sp. FERM BP-3421 TaxID=1494466 RepID=UPI00235E6A3D|nr:hypothetical protein [Burkholderia sp. FERM BP-3421]WDD95387.1 hypothetical protein Bsp3421_005559 [Burkholderia sp. FERM BP-3421]
MQHEELIGRTHFARVAPEEASPALEGAARQAADLAVLALFASFERFVIAHLQAASHLLAAGYPQQYATRLADKFTDEVEYWRFGEILNLFKAEVDPHLIGQVKQIKRYRDRIAHSNPGKPSATQVTPEKTFDILTMMIERIRQAHVPPAGNGMGEARAPESAR